MCESKVVEVIQPLGCDQSELILINKTLALHAIFFNNYTHGVFFIPTQLTQKS